VFLEPLSELRWAYQLHYYICFRTRWRRDEFYTANREASLSRTLADICGNHDYHLLEHKVYPDHLRCLVSLKPDHAISKVLNTLKSNLSREFCSDYKLEPPLWATGYLARSVGRVRIEAVKKYLAANLNITGIAHVKIRRYFAIGASNPLYSAERMPRSI